MLFLTICCLTLLINGVTLDKDVTNRTVTHEPQSEESSTEYLTTESSTTVSADKNGTESTTTESSSMELLTTETPHVDTSTEKTSTNSSSTESPSTESPTTEAPSTEALSSEAPSTESPSTETPRTTTSAGEILHNTQITRSETSSTQERRRVTKTERLKIRESTTKPSNIERSTTEGPKRRKNKPDNADGLKEPTSKNSDIERSSEGPKKRKNKPDNADGFKRNNSLISRPTTEASVSQKNNKTSLVNLKPENISDIFIKRPNIVFIVADDLGWDDVSFHGSDQILTPNIDTIAYKGIILHNYYTDTLGTPSRSAFFTGKYPHRLGAQGSSIKAFEDRGIPTTERLLPEHLKKLGYKNHLVGKWHVGKSREHYLPTNRGFDTFYGFLGGSVDYFTYNKIEVWNKTSYYGLDFFENQKPVEYETGHLTDVLTQQAVKVIRNHDTSKPLYLHVAHAAPHAGGGLANLQPPADTVNLNDHIAHSARRLYAGLVTSLDKSVGHILSALAEKDILQNTLIVFVSDNGAPSEGLSQNFGSNLPLRGMKNTPWDGGARSVALVWHPLLSSKIWNGLFHVSDWLPTLVAAAGGNVDHQIDGINQWDAIKQGQSKRNDVLITIDDQNGWAAFREGDLKIIVGALDANTSEYYGMDYQALRHEPPAYEKTLLECETYLVLKETLNIVVDMDEVFIKRNESNLLNVISKNSSSEPCVPTNEKGCLFNITDDPLEINNLWDTLPEVAKKMTLRLRGVWAELKPRAKPQIDLRADPAKHNYIWFPWVQNDEKMAEPLTTLPVFPLQVSLGELQYLVDLNLQSFKDKVYESIQYMGNSFMRSVGGLFNFSK